MNAAVNKIMEARNYDGVYDSKDQKKQQAQPSEDTKKNRSALFPVFSEKK